MITITLPMWVSWFLAVATVALVVLVTTFATDVITGLFDFLQRRSLFKGAWASDKEALQRARKETLDVEARVELLEAELVKRGVIVDQI